MKPANNYQDLKTQFFAQKNIIESKISEVKYYQTNWFSKEQVRSLENQINDEINTNETLTNHIEKLENQIESMKCCSNCFNQEDLEYDKGFCTSCNSLSNWKLFK